MFTIIFHCFKSLIHGNSVGSKKWLVRRKDMKKTTAASCEDSQHGGNHVAAVTVSEEDNT